MIKQVDFVKDILEYFIADKMQGRSGNFYASVLPCYSVGEDVCPIVRLRIVFYYKDENRSVLVMDMPVNGLQLKWAYEWTEERFPQLSAQLRRRFADAFEIIGRQVVMKKSFHDLNSKYYGKYQGYKL